MENIEDIKMTDEDVRKEKIQVNQYFKKESFLLKNLHNKKYTYDVDIFKNVYVIQYKKINKKKYKEFVLLKEFFTFRRDYRITEETQKLINDLIEKQKRR